MTNITDAEKVEKAAQEELFDGHGCLTGDCPHEKTRDCFVHFFKEAVAWRDQNPKPPAEDDAKLRDELAGEYECASQFPEREWSENDYKYRDFQAGWNATRAQESAKVDNLMTALKLIQSECPSVSEAIGLDRVIKKALREFESKEGKT